MTYPRNPLNAPGPFYVVENECIACGAPEAEAGGLMSHDDTSQCYFLRQPTSAGEVDAAISATWSSCCGAVRYGGQDQAILTRFAELDMLLSCDFQPDVPTPVIRRDRARFRYSTSPVSLQKSEYPRILIDVLAGSITPSKYSVCGNFHYTRRSAAFTYTWGITASINEGRGHSIRVEIENDSAATMLLKLSQNEAAVSGTAGWIDKVLRQNPLVQDIRWFSSEIGELEHVRARPY
jgi:hypothetical protein